MIINWTIENKEMVLETKFNKVKTTMQPLIDKINEIHHTKDMRIISLAVFGEGLSRKELLAIMKEIATKQC